MKNDPVQRLAHATVNSQDETETSVKLNALDIHTLSCNEGKRNAGNPMNVNIFQSRNLQDVGHS